MRPVPSPLAPPPRPRLRRCPRLGRAACIWRARGIAKDGVRAVHQAGLVRAVRTLRLGSGGELIGVQDLLQALHGRLQRVGVDRESRGDAQQAEEGVGLALAGVQVRGEDDPARAAEEGIVARQRGPARPARPTAGRARRPRRRRRVRREPTATLATAPLEVVRDDPPGRRDARAHHTERAEGPRASPAGPRARRGRRGDESTQSATRRAHGDVTQRRTTRDETASHRGTRRRSCSISYFARAYFASVVNRRSSPRTLTPRL